MKMFVTGGTGFIGSTVVRLLCARGYAVRSLVRSTSSASRLTGLPCEIVLGDVCDRESIVSGMAGCDGVIHLAGVTNWAEIQSARMPRVAVDGTQHVLCAARQHGKLRTVFVSSTSAINATSTPVVQDEATPFQLRSAAFRYAHAKRAAEGLCGSAVARGLPVVIVNPSEVYGPGDDDLVTAGNLLMAASANPVIVCSGGTGVVHVEDVAHGILAAFERGRCGDRYILSSENLTLRQIAAHVLEFIGEQRRIVSLPRWVLRSAGALASQLKLPMSMHPAAIPYATQYWFVDNAKSRRELGLEFRSAKETLFETLQWLEGSQRLVRHNTHTLPRVRTTNFSTQQDPGADLRGDSTAAMATQTDRGTPA